MAPHAMLEEIGAEYELVMIERREDGSVEPADFAGLSPHGRVPVLRDGDLVLHESAAIVLHLGDRFAARDLLPPVGSAERAHAYRLLTYLTNTVQATLLLYLYPQRLADGPGVPEAVRAGAAQQLDAMFDHLDGELVGRPYLLGERVSAPDLYLFMLTRWGRNLARQAWSLPNVGEHFRRLSERESVRRMLERQGIEAYAEPVIR
jgi:glutathione S-transferase